MSYFESEPFKALKTLSDPLLRPHDIHAWPHGIFVIRSCMRIKSDDLGVGEEKGSIKQFQSQEKRRVRKKRE